MQTFRTIDLNWVGHPRSIATALLLSEGQSSLIDPGPTSTIGTLQEQLGKRGLRTEDLDSIFLTHIHLDHAGATGSLVKQNPNLKVYVHAKGAPHMADPTKLLNSAVRLYGEKMDTMFGDFLPVPSENLHALEGGESLRFGAVEMKVLHTPGHASHHVTYFAPGEGIAFVGDTTGICVEGNRFVLPATPPPDIHLELWNASLDAIAALRPNRLFLTHLGFSDEPGKHIESYRERLYHWSALVERLLATTPDENQAMQAFADSVSADAADSLSTEEAAHYVFNGALNLSWMGLARYHRKKESSTSA